MTSGASSAVWQEMNVGRHVVRGRLILQIDNVETVPACAQALIAGRQPGPQLRYCALTFKVSLVDPCPAEDVDLVPVIADSFRQAFCESRQRRRAWAETRPKSIRFS